MIGKHRSGTHLTALPEDEARLANHLPNRDGLRATTGPNERPERLAGCIEAGGVLLCLSPEREQILVLRERACECAPGTLGRSHLGLYPSAHDVVDSRGRCSTAELLDVEFSRRSDAMRQCHLAAQGICRIWVEPRHNVLG